MNAYKLDLRQVTVLRDFVTNASLPILNQRGDRPEPWGTGTLFEIEGRTFLVTAAHVVENVDASQLRFPSRNGQAELRLVGACDVHFHAASPRVDVCIIEFKSETTINTLHDGWRFMNLKNIHPPATNLTGTFIIVGYPEERHFVRDDLLHQVALTLITSPLDHTPDVDEPAPRYDQFFNHALEGELFEGGTQRMPRLNGASGASVWVYNDIEPGELWTPERTTKIVGVQVSARHGTWFRAAGCLAIREIFRSAEIGLTTPP